MRRTVPALLIGLLALLGTAFAPATSTLDDAPTAIPLATETPDWYTPELHAKVLAAAEDGEGVPLPDGVEVPASALAFTGIRPGSWMLFPSGCTMNFVFGSPGSDSYIGTAGHCAQTGEAVTIVAAPGILMNIGTTAKSVDNGVGDDFALIDIRPSMEQHVNPSTAYFGGPTAKGDPRFGDPVTHAGHGLVIGTGGTPRAGVVTLRDGSTYAWAGAATPGDSGSFVLESDGTAAGNLTHLVAGTYYQGGDIAGTSIGRMLRIAGKPLATAPQLPDPLS